MNDRLLTLDDLPPSFIRTDNEELCFIFFNDHIFINTCHYGNKTYKTIVITKTTSNLTGNHTLVEHTHYLSKRQTLQMLDRLDKTLKEINSQILKDKMQ